MIRHEVFDVCCPKDPQRTGANRRERFPSLPRLIAWLGLLGLLGFIGSITWSAVEGATEEQADAVGKGEPRQRETSGHGSAPLVAHQIQPGVSKPPPAVRRPVAAVRRDKELWVANSRSGTISLLDLREGKVVREFPVAESIADMHLDQSADGPSRLLVLDAHRHALDAWRIAEEGLVREQSIPLPDSPVRLVMSSDQETLAVSSLWSRQVSLLRRGPVVESSGERTEGGGAATNSTASNSTASNSTASNSAASNSAATNSTAGWELRAQLELPFAPRELLFHPGSRWLVAADGFTGRLAVIDCQRLVVRRVVSLRGQHLHGLANRHDGEAIWITMQQLNSYRETTHEEVFWGRVLRNVLMELPWDRLTNPDSLDVSNAENAERQKWDTTDELSDDELSDDELSDDELSDDELSVDFLGRPQEGAGDPGQVLTFGNQTTLIALAGIHEIAVRTRHTAPLEQRRVGRRPVALVADEESERAYIVNQMDDTVSVLDLKGLQIHQTISLGPERESSVVERGEELFYDARLSLDGWYSCHSCHTDGHTTGELNDNFGDDTFGAPKRILSLLGGGETGPWAWHGKVKELEEQVAKSIRETMQGDPASLEQIDELTAFVRQLPPPPTGEVRRQLDPTLRERGSQLFHRRGCVDCHASPTYTSPDIHDVGLEDEVGRAHFNPPSLRGVAHRDRLFHDNRASSLSAVFSEHGHPSGEAWDDEEIAALVEFLFGL